MFFPKTIESITKNFLKAAADLEEVSERHLTSSVQKQAEQDRLQSEIRDHLDESAKARRISEKIKELLA